MSGAPARVRLATRRAAGMRLGLVVLLLALAAAAGYSAGVGAR